MKTFLCEPNKHYIPDHKHSHTPLFNPCKTPSDPENPMLLTARCAKGAKFAAASANPAMLAEGLCHDVSQVFVYSVCILSTLECRKSGYIHGRCKDSMGFAVLSPLSSPLSVGGSVTVLVSCVICHRPTLKTGSSQNYDMFQKTLHGTNQGRALYIERSAPNLKS